MKREELNEKDLKVYDAKLSELERQLEKETERYYFHDNRLEAWIIRQDIKAIRKEIVESKKAYAIDCDAKKDVYSIKYGRIIRNENYF